MQPDFLKFDKIGKINITNAIMKGEFGYARRRFFVPDQDKLYPATLVLGCAFSKANNEEKFSELNPEMMGKFESLCHLVDNKYTMPRSCWISLE